MSDLTNISPGQGSLLFADYAKDALSQDGRIHPNCAPPLLDDMYKEGVLDKTNMAMLPSAEADDKLFYIAKQVQADYFDVVRNSPASFINWRKQIEQAPANVPRIDFRDGCPVILVEEARTNLLTYSYDFSSGWSNTNTVDTPNAIKGLDGLMSGMLLTDDLINGAHSFWKTAVPNTGVEYARSAYIKKGTAQYIVISTRASVSNNPEYCWVFDWDTLSFPTQGTGQTREPDVDDFGDGWYRITIFTDNVGSNYTGFTLGFSTGTHYNNTNYQGDGTLTVYFTSFQMEEGSYPTTYIKTEATTQTREADIITVTLPDDITRIVEKVDGVVNYPLDAFPLYQLPVGRVEYVLGYFGDEDATGLAIAYLQRVAADGGKYDIRAVECMITAWDLDGLTEYNAASSYLVPVGYKPGTLYGQKKADTTTFDFTSIRNGLANKQNTNGLLELVDVDIPRVDFKTGGCNGLLNEEAGENLITYPISFDNVYWTKAGATIEGDPSTADNDLFSGWDFNSGWSAVSGGSINSATSFSGDADGGGIRYLGLFTANKLYKLVISATTDNGNFQIQTYGGGNVYADVIADGSEYSFLLNTSGSEAGIYFRTIELSAIEVTKFELYELQGYLSPHADYPQTAYKLVEDDSFGIHSIVAPVTDVLAGKKVSQSIYAKQGERKWLQIKGRTSQIDINAWFDLDKGILGTVVAGTASIEPLAKIGRASCRERV